MKPFKSFRQQPLLHQLSWLLICSLIVASLVFRFLWLDLLPSGLNWDEAAYGYNAWSILKTGMDEWGVKWPTLLKSFGDFKPALLSYLQIPFIYIGGLNAIFLRLPVALLGITSLIGWFFIQKKLRKHQAGKSQIFQFLSLSLMAITPLHIHYSRAAMDPIVSFSFLMMGFAAFIQKQHWKQWLGLIGIIISMYTYNSARIFAVFVVGLYIFIFEKKILAKFKNNKSRYLQIALFSIITILTMGLSLFTKVGARAQSVFVLNNSHLKDPTNEALFRSTVLNLPAKRIFANKIITASYLVAKNYLSHFDISFLFFNKHLSARHGFSKHGNLLLIALPFLLIGLFNSTQNKNKINLFFLLWLITAPLAAALSSDVPHSGRILVALPAYIFFITKGIEIIIGWLEEKLASLNIKRHIFLILILVGLILNFCLYVMDLYRFFPEESFLPWQGDAQLTTQKLDSMDNQSYENIYVSNTMIEAPILYAFYNQFDPSLFQKMHRVDKLSDFGQIKLVPDSKCLFLKNNALVISKDNYSITNEDNGQSEVKLYKDTIYSFNRFGLQKSLGYIYDTNTMGAKELKKLKISPEKCLRN